ncbi:lytic polysaccharide monooxygenase [Hyaloscypha variabilis]
MQIQHICALAGAVALVSKVAAHGTVTGVVADGVYYEGYHSNFQYLATQPIVVGWSIPEDQSNGFIAPDAYASSDIICHLAATNAQTSATVAAGGQVELQWTVWPTSHHGPVIDYLANCNGDCTTVDKTTLEFFKIGGTVIIPSDIAPGNYVLRHEIIALHSAGSVDGAQNYPQCVNLEVTGSGTATPDGVLGTALYSETDPGIEINIYTSLSTYIVPGPTLYSSAISATQTGGVAITSIAAVATGGSSAATASPAISSASNQVVSSSAVAITSIASASGGVIGIQTSGAPYLNSTFLSTKKSACKSKSSKPSAAAVITTPKVVAVSTSSEPILATSVTITKSLPAVPVTSSGTGSIPAATTLPSAPTSTTSSAAITEPAGATLSDLLSWISSFYNKFKGTSYDGNTVARRHARDVARAEMEKFDRAAAEATGTHHHHPHGTGFAEPTGAAASSFAVPTSDRHFTAAEFHP